MATLLLLKISARVKNYTFATLCPHWTYHVKDT
jgi:hypothetical protein